MSETKSSSVTNVADSKIDGKETVPSNSQGTTSGQDESSLLHEPDSKQSKEPATENSGNDATAQKSKAESEEQTKLSHFKCGEYAYAFQIRDQRTNIPITGLRYVIAGDYIKAHRTYNIIFKDENLNNFNFGLNIIYGGTDENGYTEPAITSSDKENLQLYLAVQTTVDLYGYDREKEDQAIIANFDHSECYIQGNGVAQTTADVYCANKNTKMPEDKRKYIIHPLDAEHMGTRIQGLPNAFSPWVFLKPIKLGTGKPFELCRLKPIPDGFGVSRNDLLNHLIFNQETEMLSPTGSRSKYIFTAYEDRYRLSDIPLTMASRGWRTGEKIGKLFFARGAYTVLDSPENIHEYNRRFVESVNQTERLGVRKFTKQPLPPGGTSDEKLLAAAARAPGKATLPCNIFTNAIKMSWILEHNAFTNPFKRLTSGNGTGSITENGFNRFINYRFPLHINRILSLRNVGDSLDLGKSYVNPAHPDPYGLHEALQINHQTVGLFDYFEASKLAPGDVALKEWGWNESDINLAEIQRKLDKTVISNHLATIGAGEFYIAPVGRVVKIRPNVYVFEIEAFYAYLRDVYDFYDDGHGLMDDFGQALEYKYWKDALTKRWDTQYLGHWNKEDLISVPSFYVRGKSNPVYYQNKFYYYTGNDLYAKWVKNTNKGGEFIYFSTLERVELNIDELSFNSGILCTSTGKKLPMTFQFTAPRPLFTASVRKYNMSNTFIITYGPESLDQIIKHYEKIEKTKGSA